MQSYSFVPQNAAPREGQKNYVFVDEHNRHKRLKVTRACNGCRKRKIKCDAATTNTWPCSACTRLKLVCIPPSIGQGGDYAPHGQIPEASHQQAPGNLNVAVPPDASQQRHMPTDTSPTVAGIPGYDHDAGVYQPQPYFTHTQDPRQHMYHSVAPPQPELLQHSFHPAPALYSTPPTQNSGLGVSPTSTKPDSSTAECLSDALGELKIDETGVAPYIRQQQRGQTDPEAPTIEESEAKLPPLSSTSGAFIRIPPELIPDEEDAMNYFSIYFNDIHPYLPVVHRSHLYQQWRNDRSSISPLLLEAIFACAGRMSDDPAQGAQWLALANRHEPSFMDSPRLSTIQALLLLLKAREAVPKKGYYYRSWQTLKTMVSMAKDLDLHEHHGYHESGSPCGLDPVECLIQTRVWQTLLVLEIMIGGPQGRSDFGVDPETVEIRPSWGCNLEPFEAERSRQFAYFVRNARSIRLTTDAYHKIKRQKDWGADPRLLANNPFLSEWLANLPPDLQISYPPDGSPPMISSHFIGNMHSHFHLATIILHRPQLLASKSFAAGGEWRNHLSLCYNSAKCLCRLQEAILRSFGLNGLLFMLRGINFTIYCILTCTMIHLVAITSPDPEFHTDARMYFTRHMRLLEQCASSWPMPELQTQIDALRVAFSADTSKPFELKPSFPYGSPSDPYHPSPPSLDSHYQPPPYGAQASGSEPLAFPGMPVTPPISGEASDNKHATSLHSAMGFMQNHGQNASLLNVPLVDGNSWDPTRIINQWDMAFPGGASNSSTNSPSSNPGSDNYNMLPGQQQYNPAQYSQNPSIMTTMAAQQQPVSQPTYNMQPVISARDWQHSVASVFDPHGLKRRWGQSDAGLQQEQGPK